jgi:hypothetical protein
MMRHFRFLEGAPFIRGKRPACNSGNSAMRMALLDWLDVGFRRFGSIAMASLSIAGAGPRTFRFADFSTVFQVHRTCGGLRRGRQEKRRRSASVRRAVSDESPAACRLELTNSDLMVIVLAAVI